MPDHPTPNQQQPIATAGQGGEPSHRWSWPASVLVFALALAALAPTAGDFGVTWDEPAYRYSQVISAQWWRQWASVRSWGDVQAQLDPDALLYYWPYARFGINFHPPLAGQVSLAGRAVVGSWMKDYPSRRMGSIVEFALTIAIGCHFLSRRYGPAAGLVMAGSLLFMPRLYGQAHLLDTDIPGLFLWAATALAFWNGLHEPNARRWRVLVGVLLGLAFLEKTAAVAVLLPILAWMTVACLPSAFTWKAGRAAWIDAAFTLGLMLLPLGAAFVEIQMLQRRLPPPSQADLYFQTFPRPQVAMPGAILAVPLVVWSLRRLLARRRPGSPIWGVERPALETLAAIAAFAPVVGWLGNPAWWRETIVRMTHYYTLTNDRQGALPDILILYAGQIYKYSLPWHNGWVLAAITVPPTILAAGLAGIAWGLRRVRTDRIPVYFLLHLAILPFLRMFHTPAHDGVRLLLPSFFFLAAFAGWGTVWIGRAVARRIRWGVVMTAALVLAPALVSLVRIHPYELSYYNALIGGPSGAWRRGFEMTYWYDALTPSVLEELDRKLPQGAELDFLNKKTESSMQVLNDLQALGHLRPDILLFRRSGEHFPFVLLLTQDSKATAFTRLLFAMKPWFASEPRQLDGLRVLTIADPVAVSRAWALSMLVDAPAPPRRDLPVAPEWVHAYAPILRRFWGEGLQLDDPLTFNSVVFDWARTDPEGLKAAARRIAELKPEPEDANATRLSRMLMPDGDVTPQAINKSLLGQLVAARPEALVEAVDILIAHPDAVASVLTRYGYTDPATVGGYLDRDQVEERIARP
ncbi:glycosyltransferase family 39 protein [Paludisphaera mucosa]|uniref:Glycosyltransferase family 39 protein n=1 Tax=Paludisphaera mucosa TaxID=3030827 RepID=A0ABT6F7S8_9BACT|nr:glycosyltransferase family 39 protein [Paludisphaera mucosa]MDG3003636.1 glycosyltransferase family 39 protein [Paludisphaera mucosa]